MYTHPPRDAYTHLMSNALLADRYTVMTDLSCLVRFLGHLLASDIDTAVTLAR